MNASNFLFTKTVVIKVLSKYENECQLEKFVTVFQNLKYRK